MRDFHGRDVSAAWADFKFGIEHLADIERLAIFVKPFTKAVAGYCEHAEADAARKWLDEV
jgi:hypothetical protein